MGNGKGKVVPAQSTRKSTASFQGGPSTIRLMSVIPEENVEAFIAIYNATRNVGILGMPQEYFTARDALHSLMKKGAIDDHYTWKAISELLDKIDEKESTVTANYAQELLKRKLGTEL
ncbi:MAG: hypothetical protein LC132_04805 [Burkholderiales bacterium]|nr:hypothetical protein [Burkholderiales bacterium]